MARARLGGHVDFGQAPAPALGIDLAVDLRYGLLSVGVGGAVAALAGADRSQGGRVVASTFAVGLEACGHASLLALCGVGRLAHFEGGGRDIVAPKSEGAWLSLLGGRLSLEVPIGETFFVAPSLEALFPVPRQHIDIDGSSSFEQGVVVGVLGLAAGARFF